MAMMHDGDSGPWWKGTYRWVQTTITTDNTNGWLLGMTNDSTNPVVIGTPETRESLKPDPLPKENIPRFVDPLDALLALWIEESRLEE